MPANRSAFRVVFMGNFPYPRGFAGTKRVQHYIDYLSSRGVATEVLVLRGLPRLPGNESDRGEYRGVPYRIIGRNLRKGPALPFDFLRFIWEGLRALGGSFSPEGAAILFHYGQPSIENLWLLLAARRRGWRIVHDIVEDADLTEPSGRGLLYGVKAWSMRAFGRLTPRISDGLVVISRHLERKYASCGVPSVRIPIAAVVDDTPGEGRHSPARIAYAGTYGAKDGIEILLEAFQQVRVEYADCVLRLAGGRVSPLSSIRPEWRAGVEYVGYLDDEAYYRFIRESDILCMTRVNTPYANAGFPFKLGEYLATGRPVVASRVGNIEEYLRDGHDILFVEPGSVSSLRDALLKLLRDTEGAIAMGLGGREVCRRHFSPEAAGAKLLSFLECVVCSSAPADKGSAVHHA